MRRSRTAAALVVLVLGSAVVLGRNGEPAEPLVVRGSDGALEASLSVAPARPALGQEVLLELRATLAGDEPRPTFSWPDVR